MNQQIDHLNVITDNLANGATPGYRRSMAIPKSDFNDVLKDIVNADLQDASKIAVDFSQGPIQTTGRPLDFAINGDGFFTVQDGNNEYYTRSGDFHLNTARNLINSSGMPVLGTNGPISIPANIDPATLIADHDGAIHGGNRIIGKLKIAFFEKPELLQKAGPTLFSAPQNLTPSEEGDGKVMNQALESSNGSMFEEMAELITTTRSFELSQQMIRAQDDAEQKMIKYLA